MKKLLNGLFILTVMMIMMCGTALASTPQMKKPTATATTATVKWKKVSDADGYRVYNSLDGKKYTKLIDIKDGDITSYTNKELTPFTTYYYKIRSFEVKKGKRVYSNSSVAVTTLTNIGTTKVSAKSGYKTATVSWTTVSGVTGYKVYRAVDKTKKYVRIATIKNQYTYKDNSIALKTKYYYRVVPYVNIKDRTYNCKTICISNTIQSKNFTGKVSKNGCLYYYSDGKMVKNKTIDGLKYGSDGKYTTGDSYVDNYIRTAVASCTTNSMTQSQKLRAVYNYVYNRGYSLYKHHPESTYPKVGTTGFALEYAKDFAYNNGSNCYGFAALFTYMARSVGYTTIERSGYCQMIVFGYSPARHGWTEVKIDGKWYYFDPELAISFHLNLYKVSKNSSIIRYIY